MMDWPDRAALLNKYTQFTLKFCNSKGLTPYTLLLLEMVRMGYSSAQAIKMEFMDKSGFFLCNKNLNVTGSAQQQYFNKVLKKFLIVEGVASRASWSLTPEATTILDLFEKRLSDHLKGQREKLETEKELAKTLSGNVKGFDDEQKITLKFEDIPKQIRKEFEVDAEEAYSHIIEVLSSLILKSYQDKQTVKALGLAPFFLTIPTDMKETTTKYFKDGLSLISGWITSFSDVKDLSLGIVQKCVDGHVQKFDIQSEICDYCGHSTDLITEIISKGRTVTIESKDGDRINCFINADLWNPSQSISTQRKFLLFPLSEKRHLKKLGDVKFMCVGLDQTKERTVNMEDAQLFANNSTGDIIDTVSNTIYSDIENLDIFKKAAILAGCSMNTQILNIKVRNEWVRNRGIINSLFWGKEGCLSSDTMIGINRAKKSFKIRIDDLVKRFNGEPYYGSRTWRKDIPTYIRVKDENDRIRLAPLEGAIETGEQTVYEVKTKLGNIIKTTLNHPFWTPSGWKTLNQLRKGDAILIDGGKSNKGRIKYFYPYFTQLNYHPYRLKSKGNSVLKHKITAEAHINNMSVGMFIKCCRENRAKDLIFLNPRKWAVHHIDGNIFNNSINNLEILTHSQHAKMHKNSGNFLAQVIPDCIDSINLIGLEKTYDLKVGAPYFNFIANGFVVHNTAKTQICNKIADMCSIRVAKGTAGGTTIRGLTSSYDKDTNSIQAGLIPLNDTRVCVIDELDKFNRDELHALLEPLEDKKINVAKASKKVTFNARTVIMMTGNNKKPFDSNIINQMKKEISPPLVDRIDIPCVVTQTVSATDILKSWTVKEDRVKLEPFEVQNYFEAVRTIKSVWIDTEAILTLHNRLKKLNITLSPRRMHSIFRIAGAIAKMHLRNKVSDTDMEEAIKYFFDFLRTLGENITEVMEVLSNPIRESSVGEAIKDYIREHGSISIQEAAQWDNAKETLNYLAKKGEIVESRKNEWRLSDG